MRTTLVDSKLPDCNCDEETNACITERIVYDIIIMSFFKLNTSLLL